MHETAQEKKVLAMYDVRGIQKYIFRTAKVKDAIGASWIIETIIPNALRAAVSEIQKSREISAELDWCTEDGVYEYQDGGKDIQVLFIGGGNAFVMYGSRELCLAVNSLMARYTLEHTYSLQLAAAVVEKTDYYADDYRRIFEKMKRVKADMVFSKPLGTLPVMEMEIKTGYPLVTKEESIETILKQKSGTDKQREVRDKEEKIFDSYITKKGSDSTIAVVHIDGNSMGQRIRNAIENIQDYTLAVNEMRRISFQISHSYKTVFRDMKQYFDTKGRELAGLEDKESHFMIREILTAGDDITFVCNGRAALAAVEYYCREITKYTMNGKKDKKSLYTYGFSVCAGIAYIGSHFPFSAGYEVAEACCKSAKKRAKRAENMDGERIGNFVDFHICKNIHAQNFERMRRQEYCTSSGEQLLRRPYYIRTETEGNLGRLNETYFAFDKFKKAAAYFQDEENLPKSFAKELRNTYPQGEDQAELFYTFLESRGWQMPDGDHSLYLYGQEGENKILAKWYDALEMKDYFADLDQLSGEGV